ncbi:MAG TPA: PEPxxWA-CTERM sorting domain-containing protein [Phenylobacterium sp.]|nr:PEPxxWA-CTERM sorting domain-containing protein [Phenylobacterium sp.]
MLTNVIRQSLIAAVSGAALLAAGQASAAINVAWADWNSAPAGAGQVSGVINAPGGAVGVTYNGSYLFAQTSGGTDYWVDNGYTQGLVNRPTGTDIIALATGGAKTITFSKAVTNPYLAFTSWNGNVVTFSSPFTIISQGCGYWGCGSFVPSNGNLTFTGSGEVHGVLQFQGTFNSLTFTDSNESWHGFTVGIADVAGPGGGIPEPSAWALMIMGFGLTGAALRSRRRAPALARA